MEEKKNSAENWKKTVQEIMINDVDNLTEQVETLDTGLRRKTRDYNELEYRGQFRRGDN